MQRSGRRRVIVTAVLTMSVTTIVAVPSVASAEHVGPCALHREVDESTRHFVKRLIRCATSKWEVPGGATKAICIARRESGLDPTAVSEPEGLYAGLFQHSRELWPDRYDDWTRPAWELRRRALNGRTNTIVTIRMVGTHGWGPWEGEGC